MLAIFRWFVVNVKSVIVMQTIMACDKNA